MRKREEIQKDLAPVKAGSMTSYPCGIAERIMVEILLDIRDLLIKDKPKQYRHMDGSLVCTECEKTVSEGCTHH